MEEPEYLQDVILNFMLAGRDTKASTMTNLFKLLTPEAEAKMIEEFASVVRYGKHVTFEHVKYLRYCGADHIYCMFSLLTKPCRNYNRLCSGKDMARSQALSMVWAVRSTTCILHTRKRKSTAQRNITPLRSRSL